MNQYPCWACGGPNCRIFKFPRLQTYLFFLFRNIKSLELTMLRWTPKFVQYSKYYLSIGPLCSDKVGIWVVYAIVLSISFVSASPSSPQESEACSWCTFIAESKPAVMRSEEFGSYKHRHIPLPLYITRPKKVNGQGYFLFSRNYFTVMLGFGSSVINTTISFQNK